MTEYDQPAWWEIPLGIAIMLKWPVVGAVALFVGLKVMT